MFSLYNFVAYKYAKKMSKYYDMLAKDIRFMEGMHSCMSCGVCTAICPAAQYYEYDPRQIVMIVQNKDDDEIEELLRSETIWYCGQCMSCRPRCPRVNTPGYIIQALRTLSQKLGFFTESVKGRQQLAIKRTIGFNILNLGYCIIPETVVPELHPEQGGVWKWIHSNHNDFFRQFSPAYRNEAAGLLRKVDDQTLSEIKRIFEVTGGCEMYDTIERYSEEAARRLGFDGADDKYFEYIYKGVEE